MRAPLLDGLGELLVVPGPRGVRRERRATARRPSAGRSTPSSPRALRAAPRAPQDALEAGRDLEVRLLRVRVPFHEVEDDERLEQRQQPGHAPVRDEPRVATGRAQQEVDAALTGAAPSLRPLVEQDRAQADADEQGACLQVPDDLRGVGSGQDRQEVHERAAEVRVDDLQQAALAHVLVETHHARAARERGRPPCRISWQLRRRAAEACDFAQATAARTVSASCTRSRRLCARRRILDDAPPPPGLRAPGPRAADGIRTRAHGLVVVLRLQHGLPPAQAVLQDLRRQARRALVVVVATRRLTNPTRASSMASASANAAAHAARDPAAGTARSSSSTGSARPALPAARATPELAHLGLGII